MRRIFPLLGIVLLLGGISGNSPIVSTHAQVQAGAACEGEMAAETAAYIQSTGININGSDSEFYSNADSRVYLLNSEETVNLRPGTPFTNTFAVINFKETGEKSVFFVIEQSVTSTQITYSIKRGSQVLTTTIAGISIGGGGNTGGGPAPVGGGSPRPLPPVSSRCIQLESKVGSMAAAAREKANLFCMIQSFIAEVCVPPYTGVETKMQYFFVTPEPSMFCGENGFPRHTWLPVSANTTVQQALETAIRKQGLLYTLAYN